MSLEKLEMPEHVTSATEKLVWIVGSARGGTTVVNRSLGQNPDHLLVAPLTYFLEDIWLVADKLTSAEMRQRVESYKYYKLDKALSVLAVDEQKVLLQHIDWCFETRNVPEIFKLLPLLAIISEKKGGEWPRYKCWQTKCNNWRGYDLIKQGLPKAKFVFVMRDPRSCVLSLAKRIQAREQGLNNQSRHSDQIIDATYYWRAIASVSMKFAEQNVGRAVLFSFERFIANPASELNNVYKLTTGSVMDEDVLAALLQKVEGQESGNRKERYTGISKVPKNRWKSELSKKEICLIETVAETAMQKAGYTRVARANFGMVLKEVFFAKPINRKARLIAKAFLFPIWERFFV